jgi:hypothetical protein
MGESAPQTNSSFRSQIDEWASCNILFKLCHEHTECAIPFHPILLMVITDELIRCGNQGSFKVDDNPMVYNADLSLRV